MTPALLLSVSLFSAIPRVAVMDVTPRGGVSADVASTVSDALVVEVRKRSPGVNVVGAEEIRSMIGLAVEKQKLGCQEVSCLAEIGGALGAERMVTGTLGRLGETYLFAVQLIDVAHARVVRSGSATVSAKHDDLLFGAVASAVGQIFDGKPAPPLPPEPTVAAPVEPPVTAAGCSADKLFGEEQAYAAGGMPTGVGVGDFNGDGKPDIVLANYRSNSVQLFLNRGSGIFRAGVSFPLPKNHDAQDLVVADFNRDGHADVAVIIQGEDTVDVLLGDGKGGFGPVASYRVSGPKEYVRPRGLAVGDFDGDGKLDLATADSNGMSGTASVIFGDGQGHFGPGMHVQVAEGQARVTGVAAGDLDGDGRDDLVAVQDPGSASVMLGKKGRKFSAPTLVATGKEPRAAVIADLDGDGKKDLVVANCGDNTVNVLQGLGDGTFAPPHRYSTQVNGAGLCPLAAAVADFDGDGKLDIAVANGGEITPGVNGQREVFDHTLTLLLAQPGGGYKATRLLATGKVQPAYLATGHFQGPKGPSDVAASFWGPFNYDGPASLSVFLSGCR